MWKSLTAAMLLLLGMLGAAAVPTQATASELDQLLAYVGSWQGTGALTGGEKPEPFKCRMNISKGNQAKINYAGRCSLVSMNLSVSGTIAYDAKNRRFQAIMSSNAGFTGKAVGRVVGDAIVFDLAEKQVDRGGNNIRIGAEITLVARQITVEFQVEFNNSGQVLTASVPFRQ